MIDLNIECTGWVLSVFVCVRESKRERERERERDTMCHCLIVKVSLSLVYELDPNNF